MPRGGEGRKAGSLGGPSPGKGCKSVLRGGSIEKGLLLRCWSGWRGTLSALRGASRAVARAGESGARRRPLFTY